MNYNDNNSLWSRTKRHHSPGDGIGRTTSTNNDGDGGETRC